MSRSTHPLKCSFICYIFVRGILKGRDIIAPSKNNGAVWKAKSVSVRTMRIYVKRQLRVPMNQRDIGAPIRGG